MRGEIDLKRCVVLSYLSKSDNYRCIIYFTNFIDNFTDLSPLTRAPLGAGGEESAPPVFFQNNFKTVADIDTKIVLTYPTSI